jgi:electron transfer flavoprotein alpha subunit
MGILIIAEHDNHTLSPSVFPVVTAAQQLGSKITVLVAGQGCGTVAEQAGKVNGVSQVRLAEADHYQHQLAEELTPLIVELMGSQYEYVLAPSTTFGKDLLPRVAALLDVSQLSDIINIQSPDTFVRPTYAGNVLATVKSDDPVKVITVRTTAFEPAGTGEGNADIVPLDVITPLGHTEFIENIMTESDRPELTTARVVISGGRGLGNAESFTLLEKIADQLGAAVGASRAAVDAGYISNDHQVGQTGKVVAPELYIAVGISGAIQHLAGMKDSKVIVAINKDPDAPIFEVADYGLVADLFQVLPELSQALDK